MSTAQRSIVRKRSFTDIPAPHSRRPAAQAPPASNPCTRQRNVRPVGETTPGRPATAAEAASGHQLVSAPQVAYDRRRPYATRVLTELFAGITAVGTLLTSGAVGVGVLQLRATKQQLEVTQQQARTAFEDDLSREYRTIVGELPAHAFYKTGDAELTDDMRRSFFRYFDLSNEQLFHIRNDPRQPLDGRAVARRDQRQP